MPATDATASRIAGRALAEYANTALGALDGDLTVVAERKAYICSNSTIDPVTAADILKMVYVDGNNTVRKTRSAMQIVAGILIGFDGVFPVVQIVAGEMAAPPSVVQNALGTTTFTPLNAAYANTMQADGIHPNATGNGVIGRVWYDAIMHRFAHGPGKNYSVWQIDNFGSTLATAAGKGNNPDGDLSNNLYEFAYGGNPNVADDNVRVPVSFDGTALRIARRKPTSANLVYKLEQSLSLKALSWSEVTDDSIEILSTNGDFESVKYTRSGGLTGSTRNFYRLSVK